MKSLSAVLLLVSTGVFAQNVSLRPVASGLTSPIALTNAHDSRLFITQQTGQILILDGASVRATPFVDIHTLVSCCGERGLLSVAFHPQYAQNGFFFVYYTNTNGDIVIARYKVSADPNVADPGSALILKTIPHPGQSNHNGGQLQFGPDGYLYAGTGDGGSGGDPPNNAQNLSVLLGKILRLDVDRASPYIPPSNPFGTEVWAYGLRNPWRFSFDRETGDLFIGDVGQNLYEEVDFQPASSSGGENYGWRIMEGLHCYNAATCNQTGLTLPIIEYPHSGGACSVTGGYRYRGLRSTRYRGLYFYADYCNGIIWTATQNPNGSWTSTQLIDNAFPISAFGEDVNGELYVVDYSGTVNAIEDPQAPLGIPSNVVATATSSTSVLISWTAVAGALNYEVSRSADGLAFSPVGMTSGTTLTDTTAFADTAYLYRVRAAAAANAFGAYSARDLATTVIFADEPLVPGTTTVQAFHVNQLRTAINAVHMLAGLGNASFTVTDNFVYAYHVAELRDRLDEARAALGLPAASYSESIAPGTPIRAVDFEDLRSGVK